MTRRCSSSVLAISGSFIDPRRIISTIWPVAKWAVSPWLEYQLTKMFSSVCLQRFLSFEATNIEISRARISIGRCSVISYSLQVNIRYEGRPVSGRLKPRAFLTATKHEPGPDLPSQRISGALTTDHCRGHLVRRLPLICFICNIVKLI